MMTPKLAAIIAAQRTRLGYTLSHAKEYSPDYYQALDRYCDYLERIRQMYGVDSLTLWLAARANGDI